MNFASWLLVLPDRWRARHPLNSNNRKASSISCPATPPTDVNPDVDLYPCDLTESDRFPHRILHELHLETYHSQMTFLYPLLLLTKFSIISWSSQAHVCPYSVWTGFPTPCMLVYVCLCSDLTIWLLNSRNFRETATYEEDHHFYWTSWYWASGPFIHLKPKIINWAITPYLNPEIPPQTDKSDGIMITFPLALPPPLSLISPRSLSLR